MAKQPLKPHRHIYLEERDDGHFNLYDVTFVRVVSKNECDIMGLKGRKAKASGKAPNISLPTVAAPNQFKGATKGGGLIEASVDATSAILEGNGYPLIISNPMTDSMIVIRNSDPRIFGVAFEKNPDDDQNLQPWSRKRSLDTLPRLFGFDIAKKPQEIGITSFREVRQAKDGITDSDLADFYVYRIAGKGRAPSNFQTGPGELVFVPVYGDDTGKYLGIQLVLGNRTNAKYSELADVQTLADLGEQREN